MEPFKARIPKHVGFYSTVLANYTSVEDAITFASLEDGTIIDLNKHIKYTGLSYNSLLKSLLYLDYKGLIKVEWNFNEATIYKTEVDFSAIRNFNHYCELVKLAAQTLKTKVSNNCKIFDYDDFYTNEFKELNKDASVVDTTLPD